VASLRQGQWSDWIEFEFSMSPKYTVRGIARFFPTEIGRQVRLYMSCVQFDPRDPYAAMSHPEGYAGDLAERYGLYKTIGWSYDTHAIRNGALAEAAFMDDVRRTMAWRERLTLDEIERGGFDLLASAWTATDRVGHMFWRFRDEQHPAYDPARAQIFGQALEETYRIMDRIVGNIAAKLGEKDLLMVFSDHGFGTWRRGVSVNNWLMDNGWMSVRNPKAAENGFLMGLDWSQTQAYAIGLSSLYLNVRGRETNGILPAEQRASKARELRDQLMQLRDSATGAKVFRTISLRDEYRGARLEEAPDLLLGYARGYQNSKAAVGGGISGDLFHPNDDPWSGDHVATSAADIPGMFFCNRPAEKKDPHLLDLAPTALRWLKLDAPSEFEGDELA
jgi:predicted AlkP superfamily phosphohydrolase/phosphomutase